MEVNFAQDSKIGKTSGQRRSMTSSLRTVIVLLAGVATTVAGVKFAQDAASFPAPSIHELRGRLADGTREDDSGRPVEASEEDDTEKQGGREVHLFATVALAVRATESRWFAAHDASDDTPNLQRSAFPIRGPPTGV
jgi:hypothetical protein